MTIQTKICKSLALTIAATGLAIVGMVSTETIAAPPTLKAEPQAPARVIPGMSKAFLKCLTKLDYVPNSVGGLYITNKTGKKIEQGTKIDWTLQIGNDKYSKSKKMTGMRAKGQTLLFQTFIWNPNVETSCTAAINK